MEQTVVTCAAIPTGGHRDESWSSVDPNPSRSASMAWMSESGRRIVIDDSDLRELIGYPTNLVTAKISDHINELTREFIERSPFVCVATVSPEGGLDVSPRGDPPGFVRALDPHTLLLPERPGNRI